MLTFWGKAHPPEGATVRWHPAAYHGLDVAAVAHVLLRQQRPAAAALAEMTGLAPDALARTLAAQIALHDIGKFSRAFQIKAPEHWPPGLGGVEPRPAGKPHGLCGAWLLTSPRSAPSPGLVARLWPDWRPAHREMLICAIAGHHGSPPEPWDKIDWQIEIGKPAITAAAEYTAAVLDLLDPPPLPVLDERRVAALSWRLAGLTMIADWIGSNQDWFCYRAPDLSLADYWHDVALRRAELAVAAAGITGSAPSRAGGLKTVAPKIETATALQAWAESVALPAAPCLVLVEDMTGAGKTEAALVLAHRMIAAGRASGLYLALPTMATANAMFERMGAAYRALFEDGATPSLALAHGAAKLHEGFQESILPAGRAEGSFSADDADETASAQCAAWIADDRRKTFLADVGVGTIDQALLAVLPARHQAMRLFGLAERVLVVDEAHAYDEYVQRELEALLEFHAALGGSAIVLSATLPQRMRRSLARAFTRGLGVPARAAPVLEKTGYPLTALVTAGGVVEEEHAARPELMRAIRVRRLASAEEAVERIAVAAGAGAAVAWVRNTVGDAIEAFEMLWARGLDADLFHARFAMGDRLEIERAVVKRFGKEGSAEGRRGKVLVATQVVEQSLDVDFDLMVSDLAPIDLLIQRAGRLQRHPWRIRPAGGPELLVLSPDPQAEIAPDWFSSFLKGAAFVYPNHALLWITARELFSRGEIRVPEDVRPLVEAVYDEDVINAAPAALERNATEAEGENFADRATAAYGVLDFEKGYARSGTPWDRDEKVQTRLGDPEWRVRLARVDGDTVTPLQDDADPKRAWALSEVRVPQNRLKQRAPLSGALEAAARAIEKEWAKREPDARLLPLRATGDGVSTASAFDGKERTVTLRYDRVTGLRFL